MFLRDPEIEFPEGVSVPDHVLRHVGQQGDKVAFVNAATGETRTYSEFGRSVHREIDRLAAFGFGPGQVVVIVSDRIDDSARISLAANSLGGVFSFIEMGPRLRTEDLVSAFGLVNADIAYVSQAFEEDVENALSLFAESGGSRPRSLVVRDDAVGFDNSEATVRLPRGSDSEVSVSAVVLHPMRGRLPDHVLVKPDDGTAGIERVAHALDIDSDTIGLLPGAALGEQYRMQVFFFALLAKGATVILGAGTPEKNVPLIDEHKVTWLHVSSVGVQSLIQNRRPTLTQIIEGDSRSGFETGFVSLELERYDLGSLLTVYTPQVSEWSRRLEDAFGVEVVDGRWLDYVDSFGPKEFSGVRWELERDLSPARYEEWRGRFRARVSFPFDWIVVEAKAFDRLLEHLFDTNRELRTIEREADAWQKSVELAFVGRSAQNSRAFATALKAACEQQGYEDASLISELTDFITDFELVNADMADRSATPFSLVGDESAVELPPHTFWQLLAIFRPRTRSPYRVEDLLASRTFRLQGKYQTKLRWAVDELVCDGIDLSPSTRHQLQGLTGDV